MEHLAGTQTPGFDLAAVRARLTESSGPRFWRSLEELADTEAFHEYLRQEFPRQAAEEWTDQVSRRAFLRLMAASLALAGVSGCAYQAAEQIVPRVKEAEGAKPGRPLYYATALTLGGFAFGALVKSNDGRPTKVEGLPDHPASLGATDAFMQAAVLSLYDPDRSQVVTRNGRVSTWDDFLKVLVDRLDAARALNKKGTEPGGADAGIRLLTETVTSPTLADQIETFLKLHPSAKWHQYEPVGRVALDGGLRPIHRFEKARVVVSLDADFLGRGPAKLAEARAYSAGREPSGEGEGSRNRLYVVECTPSITGATADHRLPLKAGHILGFAQGLAQALAIEGATDPGRLLSETEATWVRAVSNDLRQAKGNGLVIAGESQPKAVHELAAAMNQALGNVGKSVDYVGPIEAHPVEPVASIVELVQDMNAGKVRTLVIVGGNPVYNAPADLDFTGALAKVPFRVHLSQHEDETSARCNWHIPEAHPLESWADALAFDGTASVVQPLIEPLYDGKSAYELISAMSGKVDRPGRQIVRDYWKGRLGESGFESAWRKALHDGMVAGTDAKSKSKSDAKGPEVRFTRASQDGNAGAGPTGDLEVVFQPDPTVWDGRFANNGWLQELPKPLTKITWENAALIGPTTAERYNLADGDLVELSYRGRTVEGPVWIAPGHAEGSVTLPLGYGRSKGGRVASGAGFNAFAIRTSDAPWFGDGLSLRKTGRNRPIATTQHHHDMKGRDLVRVEDFGVDASKSRENHSGPNNEGLTLYDPAEHKNDGYAWGMSININTCIGCNACVAACQAENNIPVVGRDQVLAGREMHWLRIDRYYETRDPADPAANPQTHHQPVPCMHCENAPCELVCPVEATVHDDEGLNVMVYNRCVGTRYCSNNCPYKVRHFNFFQYSDLETPSLKLLNNPDVTVRTRGVMEKCTYCTQRITAARIKAEVEGRTLGGDEVVTACQQACPTRAIVFGDVHNPESAVSKAKQNPRDYALLAELNTRPRTTYLSKIRNLNPELAEARAGAEAGRSTTGEAIH